MIPPTSWQRRSAKAFVDLGEQPSTSLAALCHEQPRPQSS